MKGPVSAHFEFGAKQVADNKGEVAEDREELMIKNFRFFSEKIGFQGVFKSEIWPSHKIVRPPSHFHRDIGWR